ncbi:MAG: ABC transporter ATP-binding protein [Bacteroidetes bacterium]|nr:ABC transporter ATP-binding protein [Bacteroidota bacterium]MBS1628494.1 ABC transporter ATP-binding protein [Bacteroidota bacterium]
MAIVLAGITPLRPWLIQLSVDKYIANAWLQGLIWICVVQLGVLLLESVLRFWFLYRINWLGQTVVNDLRKNVFQKILFQDVAYFDKTPIGTLTTRTINDIETINDVFSQGIISIIADLLTIVAVMTVMLWTDWKLTLVCLIPFPILLIATYWFKESVNKSFHRVRNAVAALNAFVQEHIVGMYVVQAFAAENREMKAFQAINKEHRNANIKAIFAYSVFFPIVEIILALSTGLLVWWGARQMLHYEVTPGIIISFILYLNLLFRPLRMLADKFNTLQMGMVAGERIFTVLDSEEHLINNGTQAALHLRGEVAFESVKFSYKPGVQVLRGVSFHIPAGKTMAIVGHTGAGKTSIISILNRLYEIDGGSILIDGKDLREYELHSLRRHIGIVLQDVFLFSGTVYENITLRDADISLERVEAVCRALGLHEFILRLPGGYQYNVMERGGTLSQGQRQIISFARALLYNPAILILDEATSSVDSESEQLIQRAIDTLIKGRTSIVIAHRLSTIRKANEIIVLDKGLVIERGTHSQLLEAGGAYQKLYTAVVKEMEEA